MSSDVRDVKALSDSCQKVQNHPEVIQPDAGRAVDEEADVHGVVAGFTWTQVGSPVRHVYRY